MNRIQFISFVHSLFTGKAFAECSPIISNCTKLEAHVEEAAEGRPPFITETMPRLHNEAQIHLPAGEKLSPDSLEPRTPPQHTFKVRGDTVSCLTLKYYISS